MALSRAICAASRGILRFPAGELQGPQCLVPAASHGAPHPTPRPRTVQSIHPRKKNRLHSCQTRPGQALQRAIRFYFPRNGNRCHLPNHVLTPPSPVSRPPFPVPEIITDIHLVRNSLVPILISSLPPFFPPPSLLFSSSFVLSIFLVDDLPSSLFFTRRKSFTKLPSPLCRRRITSLGSEEEKKRGRGGRANLDPLFASHIYSLVALLFGLLPSVPARKVLLPTHGVSWLPATDRQAIKP